MYFRAFHGVPESVKAPDGTPIGAVRGFLDAVSRMLTDHPATDLVACFDEDWRPAWRVELLPSYKAHRVDESAEDPAAEEVPDALGPAGAGHRGGARRHRTGANRGRATSRRTTSSRRSPTAVRCRSTS